MLLLLFLSAVPAAVAQIAKHGNANEIKAPNKKTDSLDKALANAPNPKLHIATLLASAQYYNKTGDSTRAFSFMRRSVAESQQINSDSLLSVCYWWYAFMLQYYQKDAEAAAYLSRTNPKYITFEKNAAGKLRLRWGGSLHRLGKFNEATKLYIEGLKLSTDTTDHIGLGLLFRNLSFSVGANGNREQAIEFNNKALREMELGGNPYYIAGVHVAMATVSDNMGDTLGSDKHMLTAIKLFRQGKYYLGLSNAMANYAVTQTGRGHHKTALKYMLESLKIRRDSIVGGPQTPNDLNILANIYTELHEYNKADYYLDSVITVTKQNQSKAILALAYKNKARNYNLAGRFKEACKYQDMYILLNDTLFNTEKETVLQDALVKYQAELKEKENTVLRQDLEIESGRRLFLIIGITASLLVLALLSVIYFIRIRLLAKRRELLQTRLDSEEQRAMALIRELELESKAAAAEQSRLLTRQEALNESLEQKNVLLSNLTAYMVRKNELITAVKENIEKLPEKDENLGRVVEQLDVFVDIKAEWDEFLRCFEDVNPGYIDRLLARCPDITPKEIKMCSYIRMNLDVKQIKHLLNTTDASVHSFRSRLRKKLGLEPWADLNAVLLSL